MQPPPYTSRIIKASALIPDTKALLAAWNPALTVAENLDRARRFPPLAPRRRRGRPD